MSQSSRPLLILGAGFTGVTLAKRAVSRGTDVIATTRDADRAADLSAIGVRVLAWSWEDGIDQLPLKNADVVYSIPPVDGVSPANIAELANRCARFVYLSSASVYGDHNEATIDEESERRPTSPAGIARLAIEQALFDANHDALIIRIVGIYGPGRTLDRYIEGGRYKLVDGGEKLTNRIHVDDLVTIILAAIDRAPAGPRAYLAADGYPTRVCDLVAWLVKHRGIDQPEEVTLEAYRAQRGDTAADRWANSYTASNKRVLQELGVEFAHPTVFDGYAAIFADPSVHETAS